MTTVKAFKKGELIVKEGDKVAALYMIQAGSVSVFLQRPKSRIDLFQLGNGQMLGELALAGVGTHPASAVAVAETKVMEIPLDQLKTQLEACPAQIKLIVKGLGDKLKLTSNDLKSARMERDNSPCPQDQTAKIFGTVFHCAHNKGEKLPDGKIKVSWLGYRQYAQRIFLENPKRLEQAVNLLVKMKMATLEFGKNEEDPDAPEELKYVYFSDLHSCEQFFEFYQYYYFKGGKLDFLKADETAGTVAMCILACAKDQPLDRHGAVRLDYPKMIEKIKKDFGLNLNNDQFAVLEQKGLFVKRQAMDTGEVFISFDLKEWERTLMNWRFLKEVDKWNEKGFVDPSEVEEGFKTKKKDAGGPSCPECAAVVDKQMKFCPECGHKLVVAA